jgi:hypothetical protein
MTKKLVWRLKEQPTSENLRELVKDGILNKDEARQILFSSETEEGRDKESLKTEIKFLRELVEKLSSQGKVVEIIREIEKPWRSYSWYEPYVVWCGSTSTSGYTTFIAGSSNSSANISSNFSSIETF